MMHLRPIWNMAIVFHMDNTIRPVAVSITLRRREADNGVRANGNETKQPRSSMTPIFDTLHEARTEQCQECIDMGWPAGTFLRVAADPRCADY